MKKNNIFIAIFVLMIIAFACNKNEAMKLPIASINIVNTITGGQSIKMGSNSTAIANNSFARIGLPTGTPDIYIFPVTDSLKPYYSMQKVTSIYDGDMYSLFLGGLASQPEGIFIKEAFPFHGDSTFGIRFVNLLPNGPNVNITLSTSATVNEFSNASYKQITEFKVYPAASTNLSYIFQVRDVTSNSIITSITLSGSSLTTGVPRFKNITLVLRGVIGGSPSPGITRVNHY